MIHPEELTADHWCTANHRMLAKTLGEFCYEQLLQPERDDDAYVVRLDGGVSYRFRARRGSFAGWHVEPGSVRRAGGDGVPHPPGANAALDFFVDAHPTLGMAPDTLGHLIPELSATLAADARLLGPEGGGLTAARLADLGYAELEGHQTGHPWIVPNKGRRGFSASDAARYAPEARRPLRLPWMAVHRDLADYRGVPGLDAGRLYRGELDQSTRDRFETALGEAGLEPAHFLLMPVHPWQWDEVVVPVFAADVAAGRIVPLGEGPDCYLPQQSIRTFTNVDAPHRHHVKLPLSILNTLVWRGLPTERTLAAPAVTAWVLGLRDKDAFLRDETRVVLLGEVASVTVRHPVLESLPGVPYQYREMLGAIWRQPIGAQVDAGERPRTLASLLHVDAEGRALVTELVHRSGLQPRAWLQRLFAAMLPPLLHFLYQYGVVFSPHGENAIVVYDEHDVPARLAVKDFVDDVNVSAAPLPELDGMPVEVSEVLLREQPEMLCQFIQSGLFVGHFRYLADLVEQHLGVAEPEFWALVRAEVTDYQRRFPGLADRFALFDLLTPDLERLCLNRNRLLHDGYRDRPERPHAAVHERVPNPLYSGDAP
ncbi:MAG: IucA/IucC family siderophore biosynthesis protein [Actinomycetota bacterium]|nr:IucA/IucC family siderophore biosynthesis protein [Actinomycetota bacterium]